MSDNLPESRKHFRDVPENPLDMRRRFREGGSIFSLAGSAGAATLAVLAVLGTLWTGFQTWTAVQTGFVEQGRAIEAIQKTLATHGAKLDDLNVRLARIEGPETNQHAQFTSPEPAPNLWTERGGYSGGGMN
jgi:hypothetical protein